MRGEDTEATIGHMSARGSPPHARGRHKLPHIPAHLPGITPACAGKTVWSINGFIAVSDHPRMRGEDWLANQDQQNRTGSPPHARGRQKSSSASHSQRADHPRMRGEDWMTIFAMLTVEGITPACAGKTADFEANTREDKDHPRMRGEDNGAFGLIIQITGSPPHARGRHRSRHRVKRDSRITPACAGKTVNSFLGIFVSPDHPRMRGEDARNG